MLVEQKTDRKFRFVEDFPEYQEQMRKQYGDESDTEEEYTETKFFGKKVLHQIARVEWKEIPVTQEYTEIGPDGRKRTYEKTVTMYEERMGELGGWLEYEGNLSQEGDCWVKEKGYVMGAARVSGDVEIGNGVEIGDSAKVMDKVVIGRGIGIGGNAIIRDSAEIRGASRIAVFGNAEVDGESKVLENAKVYGNAKLTFRGKLDWQEKVKRMYTLQYSRYGDLNLPSISGEVSGDARVYGNAVVSGYVRDKGEVFGNAVVWGVVDQNAKVGGNAYVEDIAEVTENAILLSGEVLGSLRGEGVACHSYFLLGQSASYKLIPEEGSTEWLRKFNQVSNATDEEKDKIKDRDYPPYTSEIWSLHIGTGSSVNDTKLKGSVSIYHAAIEKSKITDSVIGSSGVWYGCYVSDCEVEDSTLCNVTALNSRFKRVYTNRSTPINIHNSTLDNCSFVRPCTYMSSCTLSGVTISAFTMEKKSINVGYVNESSTHRSYLPEWEEFNVLFGDGDATKEGLGFEGLKEFYSFVYRFKNRDAYEEARISRVYYDKDSMLEPYITRAIARTEWIQMYYTAISNYFSSHPLKRVDKKGRETGEQDVEEAIVMYLFAIYIRGIGNMPLARMSDDSFQRVVRAVERTYDSIKKKKYNPDYDFGAITIDETLLAIEKEIKMELNPQMIGNRISYSYSNQIDTYHNIA